jgi:hypothetical protein
VSDDSLRALWASDPHPLTRAAAGSAVDRVLVEDRAERDKQRGAQTAAALVLALLCPALLWCAAYGVSPLVRGGYALMAAGTATLVVAGWIYSAFSRQALPGPVDSRSHLQRAAFLLSRQASLARMAWLFCAPVCIGTALIATWIYHDRSVAGGYALWAVVACAWLLASLNGMSSSETLRERRVRIEQLLEELTSPVDQQTDARATRRT